MSVRDDYPAVAVLHDAWMARPTGNGPEAVRMFQELELLRHASAKAVQLCERLRAECDAWMKGVADAVEWLGYDRQAASGPADLLPGLVTLGELAQRWTLAEAVPRPNPDGHRVIPQQGSNVCVCGEWFDAEVHQFPEPAVTWDEEIRGMGLNPDHVREIAAKAKPFADWPCRGDRQCMAKVHDENCVWGQK